MRDQVISDRREGRVAVTTPTTTRPSSVGLRAPARFTTSAWACDPADQSAWRQRVIGMGARVTGMIERAGARSFYFREPSGVLFEIAASRPRAAVSDESEPVLFPPTVRAAPSDRGLAHRSRRFLTGSPEPEDRVANPKPKCQ